MEGFTKEEAIQELMGRKEDYLQRAREYRGKGEVFASAFSYQASVAMGVWARAVELRGVGVVDYVCVPAAAAFTHGYGPEGVTDEDIEETVSKAMRGELNWVDVAELSKGLQSRNPVLMPEPLFLEDWGSVEEFSDQVQGDEGVHASWVFQTGGVGPTGGHLSAIPCTYFEDEPGKLVIFDTSREPYLRTVGAREVVDRLIGGSVPANEGSRAFVGIKFRIDEEKLGAE